MFLELQDIKVKIKKDMKSEDEFLKHTATGSGTS